ncbi:MAG: tryptophan-rich sensory protein [Candidatus Saccharibacteria bacterium]|nr:tryptophan-rich sensory protein [Candidatus Saccharibacteria bacterium]
MDTTGWYRSLNKPSWAPQESVFGTVWSILYPIIFAVNIYVAYLFFKDRIGLAVALPFWLNLLFNIAFTPIQFGLRNNWLAMLDIYLVLATIIWAQFAIWPVSKLIAIAYVPYLIWVCIATTLQTYIAFQN